MRPRLGRDSHPGDLTQPRPPSRVPFNCSISSILLAGPCTRGQNANENTRLVCHPSYSATSAPASELRACTLTIGMHSAFGAALLAAALSTPSPPTSMNKRLRPTGSICGYAYTLQPCAVHAHF